MEESLSLEETNKIRISVGLPPLSEDNGAPAADDPETQAEGNYAKWRDEQAKEKEKKILEKRIAKVKNRRELNASLKGATLGDADADVDDTLKWIKKSKKREKELAKKRQQELEEMDKQLQSADYSEKDLEGLKVAHDFEELGEGDERILTLKDSRILDNEEDELQNVEMAEVEQHRKNMELRTKKRDYTGYDDDEFKDGQVGMKRSILTKYDEELEGSGELGFRLGASSSKVVTKAKKEQDAAQSGVSVNKQLLSLDYEKNIEISDYLQEGDVGFKKPKTKKKRPTRRVVEDSGIDSTANGQTGMDVDQKPTIPPPRVEQENFVDDDDLQASLARARRAKTMKRKVMTQEEIARKLAEERARSQGPVDDVEIKIEDADDAEDGTALTFDDTSEFVRAISQKSVVVKKEPKEEPREPRLRSPTPRESEDVQMPDVDEVVEELEAGEVPDEEEDEDAMMHALQDAMDMAESQAVKVKAENDEVVVGTAAEQTFSSGLAATVNILRQQGLMAQPTADQGERERIQKQRDVWLSEYRTQNALRELERVKSRGEKKDQAQREYENRLREQQEARRNLELFKDYKPDVNIVYHDEFGRELTPKEAWKALSHRFHGKGSGRLKTERRLKKITEEKKKEAMASGETPLSMNRAFQIRQEKTGQAHFVLSVGNRGSVPQATEFLEPPTLSKGKTEKTKKKKEAIKDKNGVTDFTGVTPSIPLSSSVSPGPGSRDSPAPAMMKSSFSQVVDTTMSSGMGTPVNGSDRVKLSFGFGTKRKATGESEGTPPPKRR